MQQLQQLHITNSDKPVISRHIQKIFADKEVDEKSNMQKVHITNSDKPVIYYSFMQDLTQTLFTQMQYAEALDKDIKQNLKDLAYGDNND